MGDLSEAALATMRHAIEAGMNWIEQQRRLRQLPSLAAVRGTAMDEINRDPRKPATT